MCALHTSFSNRTQHAGRKRLFIAWQKDWHTFIIAHAYNSNITRDPIVHKLARFPKLYRSEVMLSHHIFSQTNTLTVLCAR